MLVVLLKGINVGGHRTVRPTELAKALARFDVVNVGAAGTFVVRKPTTKAEIRAQLERRLPFESEVMICDGRDVLRLIAGDPFADEPSERSIIQFVSVLARRATPASSLPLTLPNSGEWCLRVLEQRDRFVLGLHKRQMKAIGYLGQLEKLFGVPVTTRSWSTFETVARIMRE